MGVGKVALAGLLANALGFGHKFCQDVELAARLHDIGKLGIPDGLLMKPGRLTEAEFIVMQKHTTIGAQILQQCSHPAFRLAEQIALHHHEKWDGSGYPAGLVGDAIPVSARLMALADVFDALMTRRVYKQPFSLDETTRIICEGRGKHFDPDVVDAFMACRERFADIASRFADPEPEAPKAA